MNHPMSDESLRRALGGGRLTEQRSVIARAAASMTRAFTVDELAEAVPGAGMATVYRTVAAMEAAGFLERVGERGGSALFARCDGGGHHHHVVCDGCGRTAVAECPVLGEAGQGSSPDGFVITRHEVTLYGLCPECVEREGGSS